MDTSSGAHLWAETYDRSFQSEVVFELQDELVPRIVSTVADMQGVLPRSMSEVVRLKAADQMSPRPSVSYMGGGSSRTSRSWFEHFAMCMNIAKKQHNAGCWRQNMFGSTSVGRVSHKYTWIASACS